MAYRKLLHGDLVRIVGKGQVYSGRNAIVIDDYESSCRVQLQGWDARMGTPCNETICETVPNKNLIVRDEGEFGYIVDGRIDHAKKSALEVRRAEYNRDFFEDDECEYDEYDRDELIEMIVKLRNDVATLSN